ncbi:unnamed protein product [Candidula unifasciata]|uniref:ATP-dependent DNA helicase n=1 Tax=Candidula unifasciata TaxID=100452 RepID=A0A8S3YQZ4_9EUPU|nr:unnamed protein product [Candidula unifasciata]
MTDYEQELETTESELAVVEIELQDLQERRNVLLDKIAELKAILSQQEDCKEQQNSKAWDGTDFPWTPALEKILRSVFKLNSLRPMQRQTMNATLSKQDCLLIMPTGGGKSLCFQLPALVDKGLTLVVSPLVSLMEDQQMALEHLGVPSAMLNAATSKGDLMRIQDDMVKPNGELRILYVTPEKLAKSKRFMNRLEKCYAVGHLARIVIDEVHCCSQWGHDFRPDYKFLGIMKRQFPGAPILGLTATATIKVLEDVKKILSIPKSLLFKASFNRPNLYYEVYEKPSTQKDFMDELYRLISRRFSGQSGIIYCFSRKDSEEVTSDLQSRGVKAGCYHADVDAASRSRVHRMWLSGEIKIVVATVAFGMGIDKPDVRFVIHHSLSKSMENLYQESGRAGRDDQRSDCIVFYRLADVARQSSMVFTEMTGLQNLHGIVRYCIDVSSCRRSLIAHHFGEMWDSSHCNNMCDHCDKSRNKGSIEKKDVSKYCVDVLSILRAAADTDQRMTTAKLVDAWYGRGAASLKVKSVAVPPFSKETAERVLAHMLIHDYLQEDFHFTAYSTICYIVPGSKAKLLQNNSAKILMDFQVKTAKKASVDVPNNSSAVSSPSATKPLISGDSSALSVSKRTPSSASKGASTKEKPKLVIVNKDKSFLNDSTSSVSDQASHNKDNTKQNCVLKKSSTYPNSKTATNKQTDDKFNGLSIIDNCDLNFGDSDEGNFKQIPKKARRTAERVHSAKKFEKSVSAISSLNSDRRPEKRKKKAYSYFPESDSDDAEDQDSDRKRMKQSFSEIQTGNEVDALVLQQDPPKKHGPIIVSDEDDD